MVSEASVWLLGPCAAGPVVKQNHMRGIRDGAKLLALCSQEEDGGERAVGMNRRRRGSGRGEEKGGEQKGPGD